MKQEVLARTIINTMIGKYLRDIREDPDRSIRNLIDLGLNFSGGRFQKEFFKALQEMLQNEQSAYYEMVKNAASGMDHSRLKTFGMNVGFNSCTLGARIIRENEARWNFNIPWIYNLLFGTEGLEPDSLDRIITQGKELGTYVYLLRGAGQIKDEHLALLSRHPDCAFLLMVTAKELLEELLPKLEALPCCMALVEYDSLRLLDAAEELRRHQYLYGIFDYVRKENQEELTGVRRLEEIAETKAPFYILMSDSFYDFEENEELKKKTQRIRSQQEYPFILVDYISDMQKIDQVISDDSCAVAFDAEGYVYTDTGKWQGTPFNIRHKSLFEILSQVTKKDSGSHSQDRFRSSFGAV